MGIVATLIRVSAKQLIEFKSDANQISNLINSRQYEEEDELYLDKSWEPIDQLLKSNVLKEVSKSTNILDKCIFSEQFIDEEQDFGYGPASYLDPSQVLEINNQLHNISSETIIDIIANPNFKLNTLGNINLHEKEDLEYVLEYFEKLKVFYQKSSRMKSGIISYIS